MDLSSRPLTKYRQKTPHRHRGLTFSFYRVGYGAGLLLAACSSGGSQTQNPPTDVLLTGAAAMGDYTTDAPGLRRRITAADLPPPMPEESVTNQPKTVARPSGVLPLVPPGFAVNEFASGLVKPRTMIVAPGGEVFVVESGADRIQVLRDADGDGVAEGRSTFASGLNQPYGLSFFPTGTDAPTHVYVANTDGVVRFPYRPGDTVASGAAETLVGNLPSGAAQVGGGGHWTRGLSFSKDNQRMFVSVGSKSNASDTPDETRRANILSYTPDGKGEAVFAAGIRNPVGLAVDPATGALWTAVNERDELGDNLVPDYVTRVQEGGFYGWPWYYIGQNQDPRHTDKHPELRARAVVPDVLVQAHSATLGLCFYTGTQFPAAYRGHLFVAAHGSWNRTKRTGYKVVHVPVSDGAAVGYYEDFLLGLVNTDGDVWGRPVGVAVARDGALLVSDDGSGTIWRVSYKG